MRSSQVVDEIQPSLWTRSNQVVRASDSQCQSRNCPGFDPSILRHSGIRGPADEAVLNKVQKNSKINPPKKNSLADVSIIFGKNRNTYEPCVLPQLPPPKSCPQSTQGALAPDRYTFIQILCSESLKRLSQEIQWRNKKAYSCSLKTIRLCEFKSLEIFLDDFLNAQRTLFSKISSQRKNKSYIYE